MNIAVAIALIKEKIGDKAKAESPMTVYCENRIALLQQTVATDINFSQEKGRVVVRNSVHFPHFFNTKKMGKNPDKESRL